MRALLASLAFAAALGCAGARSQRVAERPASSAHPEPDPACRGVVARDPVVKGLEQVTLRVSLDRGQARIDVLAPELTPAQAAEVRSAFAGCAWRPGENGATTGTITFTFRRP